MSIKRIEAELVRLRAKIEAQQAGLSHLKDQRNQLKARLAEAKKAAKEGKPVPAAAQSESLAERIGTALSETVIEPIGELLKPTGKGPT